VGPVSIVVASAVALLKPYIAKGAEEFIKAAGKDAYEQTKELFTWIKSNFNDSDEGSGLISLFQAKPERYEHALTEILEEKADSDSQFDAGLRERVIRAAPYIKILQKINQAKNLTGFSAKEFRTGTLEVEQDLDSGEDITGVKIDRIG
jgi:hypothetical protein